jgi:hypothetical protein
VDEKRRTKYSPRTDCFTVLTEVDGFETGTDAHVQKIPETYRLCLYKDNGSHEIWNRKDGSLPRPITFRGAKKDIPPTHIRTNLWTLGMTIEEFQQIIKSL